MAKTDQSLVVRSEMMTTNTNRCKYGSEFHRVDLILYLMYNTKRSYFWREGGEGREDQLHIARIAGTDKHKKFKASLYKHRQKEI